MVPGALSPATRAPGQTVGMAAPVDPVLVAAARHLIRPGRRALLGITGPPGVGKSTLATALAAALDAPCLGMDGFHLAQRVLVDLGRADRKGAPDTFDVAGYVALLRRLRAGEPNPVYGPVFHRELEESIAGELTVAPEAPLVITEGNYLLTWPEARAELDEVWYLDGDDRVRVERLVARHVAHGRAPADARVWVERSDEANARIVAATRHLADRVVASVDQAVVPGSKR